MLFRPCCYCLSECFYACLFSVVLSRMNEGKLGCYACLREARLGTVHILMTWSSVCRVSDVVEQVPLTSRRHCS